MNENEKVMVTEETPKEKNKIDRLIDEIEMVNKNVQKHLSYRAYFIRGLWQGLGIVIGSTIFAGMMYSLATKIVDRDTLKSWALQYKIESESKK